MKYLERFFRYVSWAVLAAIVGWIFKKAFQSAARQSGNADRQVEPNEMGRAKTLVRDPVCGTYVAEDISYSLTQGGEDLHFCSRDCMEHYRATNRIAARA